MRVGRGVWVGRCKEDGGELRSLQQILPPSREPPRAAEAERGKGGQVHGWGGEARLVSAKARKTQLLQGAHQVGGQGCAR